MKRTGLLLLTCLLLALRTVAQAPEKAAPDDLVVTAEIVGYGTEPKWLHEPKRLKKHKPAIILYASVTVRNMTAVPREVFMMTCDWPTSWVAKNSNELFLPTFQPFCTANFPARLNIPAGGAMVFNYPLLDIKTHSATIDDLSKVMSFELGFVDYASVKEVEEYRRIEITERVKIVRKVYWSNTLSNDIDPALMKEIKADKQALSFNWMRPE